MSTQNHNHHHLPKFHLLLITTFSLLIRCRTTTDLPVQYYEPEDLPSELFQQWSEKHGKSYEHVTFEESLKRFENFKRNLKYVADHNSDQTGFTVGLNRFSDLSNDEFKVGYLSGVKRWVQWVQLNNSRTSSVLTCDAPSYLDWREMGRVSPVKDHGGCVSCGASTSTDAVEEIDVENKILHIDGYIHVEQTEAAIQCATVKQPISVGIDGSSIDFQLYTGGIYDGACSSNPDDINHVVMIVGYGSEGNKDYWIVKNSWGTSWGMDGYIYIKRNINLPYGVCSINALASYSLLTTLASSPSPSSSSTPSPASPPYITPPQPLPSPAAAPPPSSPLPYPPSPPPSSPPPPPSPPPSSPPPPPPSPPPSSPPPPPSPPPPSPTPSSRCGDFTYCLPGQTCCCLYESFGFCLIQGCCRYSKAVCCPESDYCCPLEYPICDTDSGLCLKDSEDKLGIALSKKKWAYPTLPWVKLEEMTEVTYQPLRWRRNGYATAH